MAVETELVVKISTTGVERKLDQLIALVKDRPRGTTGTQNFVINSQAPVADALAIQRDHLRSLVKQSRGGL